MNNALGVIVGVLAGYLTSSHYSRKASAEVQEVVDKVRLVLRGWRRNPENPSEILLLLGSQWAINAKSA
jgi:hypothetical protein